MKKPFVIGERVRCFGVTEKDSIHRYMDGKILDTSSNNGFLLVNISWFGSIKVHEKQCRRLVPKKRREFWIVSNQTLDVRSEPNLVYIRFTPPKDPENWVHVREIGKKK